MKYNVRGVSPRRKIGISMNERLVKKLDDIASKSGITRSSLIESLVEYVISVKEVKDQEDLDE